MSKGAILPDKEETDSGHNMATYFWHILQYGFTLSWPIYGYIMEVVGIIIAYVVAKYPKREKAMKGLTWKLPLIVFGVLMIFHVFILGSYYYDKERQSTINSQNSKIDELQQQILDFKARQPLPPSIISSPSPNPRITDNTHADVTITATPLFIPPYQNDITTVIRNENIKKCYMVLLFKTTEGFKFMPFNYQLPEYFSVEDGYQYQNTMKVYVREIPPQFVYSLTFTVYTLELDKYYSENVTSELLGASYID